MPEFRAVSFGLDGTLWDSRSCYSHAIEIVLPRLLPHLPEDDPDEVIAAFNAVFIDLVKKHGLTDRHVFSRRERFGRLLHLYGVDDPELAQRLGQLYDSTRRLSMRTYLRSGALLVIKQLVRREVRVGVIANGAPAIQRQGIRTLGLAPYLDFTVIGGIEGYNKPDERLFRRAVELACVPPENMLHVGESPITDILGAARAGISSAWLKSGERGMPESFPQPQFTINRLSDLLPIVCQ